jgi:hypothetical protein
MKKRRGPTVDSDDESGLGHDSNRRITKFVNNQAFDIDDDDEDFS